ncbi:alpha/beta fold hydrolase [Acinetobacter sp. WCHAc060033]|uniref:alpha/beta fold hydrolase n=1 Tax=Acinetobacter sp. WCHAc060033 TaxID=2518624 RepID=UPI001023E869|nr:alpha/beta fold hydrolase [Acinetobacter sp. WCHAc060033]RZG84083.1 alpha/beta fold hydrolase [Acinetobacter sp. WCHAc060033]
MSHSTLTQKTIHFGQYPIVVDILSHHENQHTLIILPALGVSINKYEKLTALLAENGFNVVIADYPHCGRNQPLVSKGIDYGYAELLNDFIPQLEQLAIEINGLRLILFGHSLGGHLATLYAQSHENKIIGVATGNIGLKNWDFKGKLNILKATTVINAMILKDGYFAGYKIAFGNRETKTLMRDWSKVVFSGNYKHIIGAEKVVENDALFIYLQGDDFAPMNSMLGLSGYFKQPKIETLDLTQHVKGNQHSAWLKQPEKIVELIKTWLNE